MDKAERGMIRRQSRPINSDQQFPRLPIASEIVVKKLSTAAADAKEERMERGAEESRRARDVSNIYFREEYLW